jgi:hypothetical protein
LLEGLVFGARAGEAAVADNSKLQIANYQPKETGERRTTSNGHTSAGISTAVKKRVKRIRCVAL